MDDTPLILFQLIQVSVNIIIDIASITLVNPLKVRYARGSEDEILRYVSPNLGIKNIFSASTA